jgi:N-acetylglucosaminyl-diphospho-decaprenol L-rhamnosyltransferase
VVIVHWNRAERCLETVAAFGEQDVSTRVVVVDNGSSAQEIEVLTAGLPAGVELVELGQNRGFGPAANAGFRHVLGGTPRPEGFIALAPHDAVPTPGCLRRMLDAAAGRARPGLVSADFGDGATPIVDPYFGGILGPATVDVGWEPAGHPHGTLMLAHRDLLTEVGMFDERYFAYCEEADLALRAADAGWEVGLVRGAVVRNPDLGTRTAAIDYLQLRNTLLLVREHSGRYHACIRAAIAVLQLGSGLLSEGRRGPYFDAGARMRALADHARGRYGPPPADLLAR